MNRKLDCETVRRIIHDALEGQPMIEIAKYYSVSDKTIANIIYRVYYDECYSPLEDFETPEEYFDKIKEVVARNRRRAKGRRRK